MPLICCAFTTLHFWCCHKELRWLLYDTFPYDVSFPVHFYPGSTSSSTLDGFVSLASFQLECWSNEFLTYVYGEGRPTSGPIKIQRTAQYPKNAECIPAEGKIWTFDHYIQVPCSPWTLLLPWNMQVSVVKLYFRPTEKCKNVQCFLQRKTKCRQKPLV
jgi:hypothetical protein